MMPETFHELQECDASNFTRYAALALYMITNFDFELYTIIELLSERFKVPPELCVESFQK
jgi:hypothetical protein